MRLALYPIGLALLSSAAWAGDAPAPAPKPPTVSVPTFANATCPIMGKPASRALFADTEKGRIYVCCPPCVPKIKADVARAHAAAFPTIAKAGNKICPVTGRAVVEGKTVVLQGYEVALCCADCVQTSQANAQLALVKATDAGVVDVGNMTCPVTGQAVTANSFCLVDKNLVRLSSPKAVEAVQKDPAATLEKARKIAEAQRSPRPQTR